MPNVQKPHRIEQYLIEAADTVVAQLDEAGLEELLTELRSQWRDIPSSLGRSIISAITLIAIFELLLRGAISEPSVGGFEVQDLTFVRVSLPVLVAYLLYDIVSNSYVYLEFAIVHDRIIEKVHPHVARTGLSYFVKPRQPPILGTVFFEVPGKPTGLLGATGTGLFYFFLFALAGFQVYAYGSLAAVFPGVEVVVAAIVSGLFLVYSTLIILTR